MGGPLRLLRDPLDRLALDFLALLGRLSTAHLHASPGIRYIGPNWRNHVTNFLKPSDSGVCGL